MTDPRSPLAEPLGRLTVSNEESLVFARRQIQLVMATLGADGFRSTAGALEFSRQAYALCVGRKHKTTFELEFTSDGPTLTIARAPLSTDPNSPSLPEPSLPEAAWPIRVVIEDARTDDLSRQLAQSSPDARLRNSSMSLRSATRSSRNTKPPSNARSTSARSSCAVPKMWLKRRRARSLSFSPT